MAEGASTVETIQAPLVEPVGVLDAAVAEGAAESQRVLGVASTILKEAKARQAAEEAAVPSEVEKGEDAIPPDKAEPEARETVSGDDAKADIAALAGMAKDAGLDLDEDDISALGVERAGAIILKAARRGAAAPAEPERKPPEEKPKPPAEVADEGKKGLAAKLREALKKIDPDVESAEMQAVLGAAAEGVEALEAEVGRMREYLGAFDKERQVAFARAAVGAQAQRVAEFDGMVAGLGGEFKAVFGEGDYEKIAVQVRDGDKVKLEPKQGHEEHLENRGRVWDTMSLLVGQELRGRREIDPKALFRRAVRLCGFAEIAKSENDKSRLKDAVDKRRPQRLARPTHASAPVSDEDKLKAVAAELAAKNRGT